MSETMQLYMNLCAVLCLPAVTLSSALLQDTGVISACVGDNVTLHCYYESQVAMHFSWYRQTLGKGPELLSNIYKFDKHFNSLHQLGKNPRFAVETKAGKNHLHISDVQSSDSAFYFCGKAHSNQVEFGEGAFLSVEDSGATIGDTIVASESDTVHPGGSLTFSCTVLSGTCKGEHNVYWFKHESYLGILLIKVDRCKPGPLATGTRACVSHFQKMNVSTAGGGSYHCAVALCGTVPFGNGTKLLADAEEPTDPMRLLVRLSIIRTGILLFLLSVGLLVYSRKRC